MVYERTIVEGKKAEEFSPRTFLNALKSSDYERVVAYLKSLVSLEKTVLSILYIEEEAVNIRTIQQRMIKETFNLHLYENSIFGALSLDNLFKPFSLFYDSKQFYEATKKSIADNGTIKRIKNALQKELSIAEGFTARTPDLPNVENINEEDLEKHLESVIEKTVNEIYKFPSFPSVERATRDLIGLGLVMERKPNSLESKRTKGLFFLNPEVRVSLDKYLKMKNEPKSDKEIG